MHPRIRPSGYHAIGVKMLNALFGVAYGLDTPFFPHLAAPNLAPKTELYRTCTEHFMSSIRKADFGHAVTASPSTAPIRLGPFGPVGWFRLAIVGRFWPSSKQNSKNPPLISAVLRSCGVWLANCYFSQDSSGFRVLAPRHNSGRPPDQQARKTWFAKSRRVSFLAARTGFPPQGSCVSSGLRL